MQKQPSFTILCIPRMESIIKSEFIISILEKYNIGTIKKIIELPHKNNPDYKRVIIHIYLPETADTTIMIRERFSQKKDIKIIYKFPWYWKMVEANCIPTKQPSKV